MVRTVTANPSPTTPQVIGAELSRLAGLQFDRAATLWYRGLALEAIASVLSTVLAIWAPTGTIASVASLIALAVVGSAYVARLVADNANDTAQTMRRQAAFSEGLAWPTKPIQLEEWRRKAGSRLLQLAAANPRPADYYASTAKPGPRRMAEMTRESAFYSRHMYLALRGVLTYGIAVALILLGVVVYLVLENPRSAAIAGPALAQAVAAIVLLAISLDAIGWHRRLDRQIGAIHDVEEGLDRILETSEVAEADVLRLVAEYDCELVDAIPIPWRLWTWKHPEFRRLWDRR